MPAINNRNSLLVHCPVAAIVTCLLGVFALPIPLIAQEALPATPEIWLPTSQNDQLGNELNAIIAHATTRRGCSTVLEAKLSDGSSEENPKFIITCRSENQETVNLVYWSSDVADEFSQVAYQAAPSEAELEAEKAKDQLSEAQLAQLIDRCTLALEESFDAAPPLIDEQKIYVRQRQNNIVAIFMDYQQGSESAPIDYTATCLARLDSDEVSLTIFPR